MTRAALALTALALSGACSAPCSTSEDDPVRYSKGSVSSDGTTYVTSAWEGPYLHFPGGRRYQLEHQLGKTPALVQTYLAFSENPLPSGNASESAGNQAVIERVDDEIVQVRNDTCAEFYLRVVAMTGPGGAVPADGGSD